jgi:hypothetical protein
VSRLLLDAGDPRSEYWDLMRNETIPADSLFSNRMQGMTAGGDRAAPSDRELVPRDVRMLVQRDTFIPSGNGGSGILRCVLAAGPEGGMTDDPQSSPLVRRRGGAPRALAAAVFLLLELPLLLPLIAGAAVTGLVAQVAALAGRLKRRARRSVSRAPGA